MISVKDAAIKFGMSEGLIRQLALRGRIRGRKFANVWMIDEESVRQYRQQMELLGSRKHGLRYV